jgi:hypothetical protein
MLPVSLDCPFLIAFSVSKVTGNIGLLFILLCVVLYFILTGLERFNIDSAIQRNWQHRVYKTKIKKTKTQSVTCGRSMVFSTRYNWNIVESCAKHHNHNPNGRSFLIDYYIRSQYQYMSTSRLVTLGDLTWSRPLASVRSGHLKCQVSRSSYPGIGLSYNFYSSNRVRK